METFEFYQDRKVEVWERSYFTVEALNYQEAKEKINAHIGEDITDIEMEDPAFEFTNSEMVYDSIRYMTKEENEGNPTWEVYNDDTGELLAQNK